MVKLYLYGHLKATCAQRILILLEELDLKYTFREVDIFGGEHKTDSFKKLQPFGKIPVVKYGDKTLFESRTILRYVSKNNRLQHDLFGDIMTDQWLEVESHNFNPHVSKIVYEQMFKKLMKGGSPDMEVVKTALEQLEAVLDVYENQLSTNEYISGADYSIADICHIPYAYLLIKCGHKDVFKKRPAVYNWLKRLMKRPAVRRVLEGNIDSQPEEDDEKVESDGRQRSEPLLESGEASSDTSDSTSEQTNSESEPTADSDEDSEEREVLVKKSESGWREDTE